MALISKSQIKLIRSLKLKKFRDELGLFVAEGDKCIGELRRGFDMHLCFSGGDITPDQLKQLSSLTTPQGAIAVFRKPAEMPLPDAADGLVLVLDGVQDPGNLGTIIRTCDWFGVHHLVCSAGTADCFSPKVVQATMGALARVHVHYTRDLAQYIRSAARGSSLPVYGTLLDGRNIYDIGAVPERGRGLLVMGSEGRGISPEVRQLVSHPLLVPSVGDGAVESLNVAVATAVVLAEFRRPQNGKSSL